MKKLHIAALAGALALSGGCDSFLDVNTNPNGPQSVSANLYLAPMLHWLVTSPQFDGRFVGHYTQQWISTSTATTPALTWGRMGYDPASDNGGQMWRDVYWTFGQNLIDMSAKAEAQQRWDLLGVGLILKAWGWQVLTDLHGEIIIQQAFDQSRTAFDYDSQQYAYDEVQRLLDSAIVLLNRTDGAVDQPYLAVGDKIYNGDRARWLKFAHGLLALHLNHYSNKATYDPDSVIAEVDRSLTGNAEDALLAYPCVSTDFADCNFWGRSRNNITLYRQTEFIVSLMNGTVFGGTVDPRMTRMLAIDSASRNYRGLNINTRLSGLPDSLVPRNFFGYTGSNGLGLPSRYIFADRSRIPVMTYAQLQFVKAEAAFNKGDLATARTAYINGVSAHIDFVNARNLDAGQTPTQITAAEKSAFLADTNVVPSTITLSHIMLQKYIAQWAWGHNELWMDMRRYHYDPAVYIGFAQPTTLYGDNGGEVVQRIRPRYNSEYVWNYPALQAIGADAANYHTKLLWITEP